MAPGRVRLSRNLTGLFHYRREPGPRFGHPSGTGDRRPVTRRRQSRPQNFGRLLMAVCVAQAMAILGFDFALPFMPLYLHHDLGIDGLGQIAIWSGVVGFGPAIPATIFGPLWGKLADKYGYRAMLLRAMACASGLIVLMGFAQSVWVLVALRMLQGGLTGTVFAAQALVASSAPEEDTGRAMGLLQMSIYAGSTFGPVAGGIVAQVAGYRASFVTAGCLLGLATAIVFEFVSEPARKSRSGRLGEAESEEGKQPSILGLLTSRPFAAAVTFTFIAQFAASSQFPILPLFVQQLLHGAGSVSADTGWLLAFSGVCAGAGSYVAGRLHRRRGLAPLLIVAGGVADVLLISQALSGSYLMFLVLRAATAFGLGALFALVGVWAARSSPPYAKGLAFGLVGAASSMGFGSGPLIGGLVVSAYGLRSVFVVAAALLFVGWIWAGLGRRTLIT